MTKDESVVEFCIIVRDVGDHLLVWWGADPRGDAPPSFGPAGQLGQSSWFEAYDKKDIDLLRRKLWHVVDMASLALDRVCRGSGGEG